MSTVSFFFFNDTATTEIYTLSLHDALPIYSTYISGGTVILTVILDIVLIPRYGISGAAVASSIVYTTATIASVSIFRHESGAGLLETLVIQPEDFIRYRRLLGSTVRRLITPSPARP